AIHYVGNTMIDALVALGDRIAAVDVSARHGVAHGDYLVVTLHRPALVDGPLIVQALRQLAAVSAELPVVFPVHPRTRAEIESWGIDARSSPGLQLLDPIRYLEFISLIAGAAGVLTDSGGLQEETTYLGVPCFTRRD